jgi:hypothetical protein
MSRYLEQPVVASIGIKGGTGAYGRCDWVSRGFRGYAVTYRDCMDSLVMEVIQQGRGEWPEC